jgi:hypothetical protein
MAVTMKTVIKSFTQQKKHLTKKERLFIENQNNCALCNTELTIKVAAQDLSLVEEANCPQCKIKTRVKNHGLQ